MCVGYAECCQLAHRLTEYANETYNHRASGHEETAVWLKSSNSSSAEIKQVKALLHLNLVIHQSIDE